MLDTRQVLTGSDRAPLPGSRLVGRTDGAATVRVTVILKRKNPIDPASLQAHGALLPHERPLVDHAAFAAHFGASDEAISALRAFALAHGLSVENVDAARRVVELAGSAANMEQAFGTELSDYEAKGGRYRGRRGPILIASEIHAYVEAVLGLDNRPVAKPRLVARAVQSAFYPKQVATLYNWPPGDGTGETIALIELGGNFGAADLQTYFANAGVATPPAVRSVSVSPGAPAAYGSDPDSDGEVMLDIEVAGAMAPGASIVVYFAENTDQGFYQAVSLAVHDPATTAISISWGSAEKSWSAQSMDAWNSLGQAAALLNVPIFVAAGDHGCADEVPADAGFDNQQHVDFPGSCASGVISCGGTSLAGAGSTISSETVWSDNAGSGWATGGGVSTHFPVPAWQNGVCADGTPLTMRGVPDVAGVADANTGFNVIVNGQPGVSGGTSAVAPQWAALTAVLSQALGRKAGFFLPLLYANPNSGATNDIVSGSNGVYGIPGFSATPGWDPCTGLGSPNGANILALLAGPTAGTNPAQPVAAAARATGAAAPKAVQPYNAAEAVLYGEFIEAAYAMYDAAPNNVTPPPSGIPAGYELAAWIQMQDFILGSTGPVFYGILAQSSQNPASFVLAIRGTSNGIEWWDDLTSLVLEPFTVGDGIPCGSVGSGFARIYDTLEVIERPTGAAAAADTVRSLKPVGGFSAQIASLVSRHAQAQARVTGIPQSASVVVAGHSLGAALATLYAVDNAKTDKIPSPICYTFASPRVGDSTFVGIFDQLDFTSWRIVNVRDIVPNLPPEILGFRDVDALQKYDSNGKVKSSIACAHALTTYLYLIDPSRQPDANCALGVAALAPARAVATNGNGAGNGYVAVLDVPAGSVSIDIRFNVREPVLH